MLYSNMYFEDFKSIANVIPNCEKLYGNTILVTGATGMIGSAVVDFLLYLNSYMNADIEIVASSRNSEQLQERFQYAPHKELLTLLTFDVLDTLKPTFHVDYIIHAASPASPKNYSTVPAETMLINFLGTKNVLEFCKMVKSKRLLYISSSEVYGNKKSANPYDESEYGFVDILNSRACYPSSKRAAETLCAAYLKEYGVDFVIARPGHVFGPTMRNEDDRAASQFIREAISLGKIVMKSNGFQMRSHCYIADCVSSIFTILLNGKSGSAYNVSNPNSVSTIREFAECVATITDAAIEIDAPSDEEASSYNMMDNSSLDSDKIQGLGWKGCFDLKKGIEHTVTILTTSL